MFSLSILCANCGFKIVIHPMTLDFHHSEMPWDAICREAVQLGYCSHLAGNCGLHIHINRTAFGETEYEQDECIARILYFFEKHWSELLKFSRRTEHQLERWETASVIWRFFRPMRK